MNLTISGPVDDHYIPIIEDFCHWAAKKLTGKRIYDNLDIDIEFNFNNPKNIHTLAECGVADGEYRPRWFDIEIFRQMCLTKTLHILGHELTHVKQLAKRQWVVKRKQGKFVNIWEARVRNGKKYWDAPWEIEARGMEHGLYNLWMADYMKRNKLDDFPVWHTDVWS